jgi:hypothetical protein
MQLPESQHDDVRQQHGGVAADTAGADWGRIPQQNCTQQNKLGTVQSNKVAAHTNNLGAAQLFANKASTGNTSNKATT